MNSVVDKPCVRTDRFYFNDAENSRHFSLNPY